MREVNKSCETVPLKTNIDSTGSLSIVYSNYWAIKSQIQTDLGYESNEQVESFDARNLGRNLVSLSA
jgi:hypothetical protein